MGYADGYYYGQGKIICDTATFTAGDTIRVRSMTDATKIWDKTVVTAGTPLIFDVPGKDYYKICTVQEISDVETEIGGVYKTVDYGQTLFIDVLDKTTLGGIQGILNAHQETSLLNIGDEVDIKVNGSPETFVLAHLNAYASHSAIFCKKQTTNDSLTNATDHYRTGGQKAWCDAYYNTIDANDKQFIKQKVVSASYNGSGGIDNTTDNYIWTPTAYETGWWAQGINDGEANNPYNVPFDLFATAQGRIRGNQWFTATHYGGSTYYNYMVIPSNGVQTYSSSGYMLPCFMLTADT